MGFIAGPYTATLGAQAIGQAANGYTISHSVFKELVTGDAEALTPQDAVYQGHEVFVSWILQEYDVALAQDVFWPYGTTTEWGAQGQVGRMDVASSLVSQLILDDVAGTPAATKPLTATFPKVILAEGFPVEMIFGNTLRRIPIRMRAYPSGSAGSAVFATFA